MSCPHKLTNPQVEKLWYFVEDLVTDLEVYISNIDRGEDNRNWKEYGETVMMTASDILSEIVP